MRRRICCVGLVAAAGLGLLAAPVRAEDGIDEQTVVLVQVAGVPIGISPGGTTSSCEFNQVRAVLCSVLFKLSPVRVHVGSGDNQVLVSVEAHHAPAPTGR